MDAWSTSCKRERGKKRGEKDTKSSILPFWKRDKVFLLQRQNKNKKLPKTLTDSKSIFRDKINLVAAQTIGLHFYLHVTGFFF